jgi:hypothetical protein
MNRLSFEGYMDEALGVEYGGVEPALPAGLDTSADSDERLGAEALAVACALKSARMTNGIVIAHEKPILGVVEQAGWDLTELAPAKSRVGRTWLALDINGDIFECSGANLMPGYSINLAITPDALIAKGRYFPNHGTVIDNETIRYGLARLVARHIYEMDESSDEVLRV